jgi:hypothetical protein
LLFILFSFFSKLKLKNQDICCNVLTFTRLLVVTTLMVDLCLKIVLYWIKKLTWACINVDTVSCTTLVYCKSFKVLFVLAFLKRECKVTKIFWICKFSFGF